MNATEKLKALDNERAKVLEEVKSAALQKAQATIQELKQLGLRYRLVQEAEPPKAGAPPAERSEAKPPPTFDQTLYGS